MYIYRLCKIVASSQSCSSIKTYLAIIPNILVINTYAAPTTNKMKILNLTEGLSKRINISRCMISVFIPYYYMDNNLAQTSIFRQSYCLKKDLHAKLTFLNTYLNIETHLENQNRQ